jgi:Flp pilus assembly protein TadG
MTHHRFLPGQIGVILTLVIATLLGAVALGTDVAVLYFNWVQLQKAADAAALAGAGELTALPDPSGTVAANATSTGEGYACLNGINDPSNTNATLCPNPVNNPSYVDKVANISVNASNTQFSIRLTRQVPYYFARLIGLQTGNVAAGATAQVLRGAQRVNGGLFPTIFQCKSPCNGLANLDPVTFVSFGQKFPQVRRAIGVGSTSARAQVGARRATPSSTATAERSASATAVPPIRDRRPAPSIRAGRDCLPNITRSTRM